MGCTFLLIKVVKFYFQTNLDNLLKKPIVIIWSFQAVVAVYHGWVEPFEVVV